MTTSDRVDRLLHDVQGKINGALFALALSPVVSAKHDAVILLREADALIDEFAEGEEGT